MLRDFRLPPRYIWDLRSSRMLRSVDWVTDVSGQPIGQTLEDGTDSLAKRRLVNYQPTLRNIQEEPRSIFRLLHFLYPPVSYFSACQGCLITVHPVSETYLLTYLLTYSMVQSPWAANWFAASQEIPRISRNQKLHTALTTARHLFLSWASPIQSTYPHLTSWRSILILSTHLRLGLPNGLFTSGFPTKTLCTSLSTL